MIFAFAFMPTFVTNKLVHSNRGDRYIQIIIIIKTEIYITRINLYKTKNREIENKQFISYTSGLVYKCFANAEVRFLH
jgi:hypothetical protein